MQRVVISVTELYSSSSTALTASASLITSHASRSIQVVRKVARFRRGFASSCRSSRMI